MAPQQLSPVVSLNSKTDDIAYSGVSIDPGASSGSATVPLSVSVGGSTVVGNISWLEVPRSVHDCRHADAGTPNCQ